MSYTHGDRIFARFEPVNLATLRDEVKPLIGRTFIWEWCGVGGEDEPYPGQDRFMIVREHDNNIPEGCRGRWVPLEDLQIGKQEFKPITLPDKLSDLMQLALDDLAKVEQDPQYRVNMGDWHNGTTVAYGNACVVCFAGAVMAKTLGVPSERFVTPARFDEDTRRKLYALDKAREGYVGMALARLGKRDDVCNVDMRRYVVEYAHDPKAWRDDMNQIIKHLREKGL